MTGDPFDHVDSDTVDLMAAILMAAGADMIEPGTAVAMLTDEASPFVDVDTLVMRAAVEAIKAVADMGDVDAEQLGLFVSTLRALTSEATQQEGQQP